MLRYAITDRRRLALDENARQDALLQLAQRWGKSEVDFVQLREKDMSSGSLAVLARKIMEALSSGAKSHRCPKLIINSSADVALAVGASGVHLSSAPGGLTPAMLKRLYASAGLPDPVVSVSCHSTAEIANACEAGANLILFGPIFEKRIADPKSRQLSETSVSQGIGLDTLRLAARIAGDVPVLALGGVSDGNISSCLAAGAAGVAAIRLFTS